MLPRRALTIATLLSAGALALPGAALAAYPGANGELALTSTQDGGARHIFAATGTGIVDLTGVTSPAVDVQPKFSPDGREILFTRSGPGLPNTELFVMGANGSQATQLTRTPTGNSDATWSPDGTEIAFVSERDNEVPNIYIMRADGTGVRQITHDTAGKSELAWSPRGDRIAFVRVPAGGGDREIYSVKTDGSGLTDLSNDPNSYDVDPAWSPDGTRLAYSGPFQPGASVGGDLWIMNADGSGRQALVHENNKYSDGAYPAWSPDGTTIAFTANNGTGYYHVWSVSAAGGQNAELVTNKVAAGNPVDQQVDWQPAPTRAVPKTRIASAVISEHAARFSFAATGPATGYRCALTRDKHKAAFKRCSSGQAYKHLKPGRYTFSVIASGPDEPYRTPARHTFKIR
jgi:dipeptidyl aminopeptidase/acylaminoacyl peptidase